MSPSKEITEIFLRALALKNSKAKQSKIKQNTKILIEKINEKR